MTIKFGTISHGTLRSEDLLEAFADELDYQRSCGAAVDAEHGDRLRKLVDAARAVDPEHEDADELVAELQDALSELAPSYAYFGSTEGDGSDFGFWPDVNALEDAVRDGEVTKVNAGDALPYDGEYMVVTDHGNVTYVYVQDGTFHEVWSCV